MSEMLANPMGANQTITTFVSGRDQDGMDVTYWQEVASMRADAVITRGQVLIYVAPTATTPPSVTPMLSGSAGRLFAGVALANAVAGATVKFCTRGFCRANMTTSAAAANEALIQPSATGEFVAAAAAFDGTTVVGATYGTVMGARQTDNRCLVRINHL